jgi:hypothetical protein
MSLVKNTKSSDPYMRYFGIDAKTVHVPTALIILAVALATFVFLAFALISGPKTCMVSSFSNFNPLEKAVCVAAPCVLVGGWLIQGIVHIIIRKIQKNREEQELGMQKTIRKEIENQPL